MTSGARVQQSMRGGLSPPPISSPSAAWLRLMNQMWSMLSTLIPVTCCMLQRFGSGFGQNGSTLNLRRPALVHGLPGRLRDRIAHGGHGDDRQHR